MSHRDQVAGMMAIADGLAPADGLRSWGGRATGSCGRGRRSAKLAGKLTSGNRTGGRRRRGWPGVRNWILWDLRRSRSR